MAYFKFLSPKSFALFEVARRTRRAAGSFCSFRCSVGELRGLSLLRRRSGHLQHPHHGWTRIRAGFGLSLLSGYLPLIGASAVELVELGLVAEFAVLDSDWLRKPELRVVIPIPKRRAVDAVPATDFGIWD
jgi:hypothetical protein